MQKNILKIITHNTLYIILILFGVLGLAKSSLAATYYVDFDSGDDNNSGLSAVSSWKHAPGDPQATAVVSSTVIASGDIIFLKGDVIYHGKITIGSANYNNGTVGNVITLKSGHLASTPWGVGRAVIEGDNTRNQGIHIGGRSYIRLEGFEIKNMANLADSAGIFVDGNIVHHCEIIDNLIHHIYGGPGSSGYGIELTGGTVEAYHLVEKNIVYFVEEKAIEAYRQGYSTFRYNFLYQTNDHNMVISSPNNEIYSNLFREAGYDWDGGGVIRPAFCFKFDSGTTVYANNNKFYNNLLWDCNSGLGILNGDGNEVYQNTIYYSGWGDLASDGAYEGRNFVIIDDGTAGSNKPDSNIIQNNIFYYGGLTGSSACDGGPCYPSIGFNGGIGNNNIIENNIIFWDTNHTSGLIYYRPSGSLNEWHDVTWFEGSNGFSHIGTGNIARNNITADPQLLGGSGPNLINSVQLPTGFDLSWHPNKRAFALTDSSTGAINRGIALTPSFNIDIEGTVRPQGSAWDIGAYEYVGGRPPDTTPPSAPTGVVVN